MKKEDIKIYPRLQLPPPSSSSPPSSSLPPPAPSPSSSFPLAEIEPESTALKARVLTTILAALDGRNDQLQCS